MGALGFYTASEIHYNLFPYSKFPLYVFAKAKSEVPT